MLLIGIILWSLFPILALVKASFSPSRDLLAYPPKLFGSLTFENFRTLSKDWGKFYIGMLNSVLITLGSATLTIIITLPTAYAFSRFARTKIITNSAAMLIIARMFPPIVITIPLYPVLNSLNLVDNHVVLIVLYTAFYVSLGTLTMKSYFDNVPIELEESALIEGCSKIKAFFIILLPLSTTGIMSVGILVSIFAWKEFLFAFLFTTSLAVTAPVVLNEMLGGMFGVSWGPLFAAATIHLVPISILIVFSQRFIVDSKMLVREK